jgi:vitamin B12 transporter
MHWTLGSSSPIDSTRILARVAAVLCLMASVSAQQTPGSISGAVVDSLGGRVAGARVALIRDGNQTAETVSDAQGEFGFETVASGRYHITVSAAGFEPHETAPFFAGTGRTMVEVPLQIGLLTQDVVVTASATEVPAAQVGASVTVLDHSTLDTLAKPDVLEAVRLVPGADVVQTGARGGITSVFIRGGDSDMNKVLIDGVPANDIGGAFDFSDVTMTGIDRVEVLRDANSVLHGSDALTGVISLTTRRGDSRTPELSLALDGGTFDTLRQDASLGGMVDRFDYFAEFSRFSTSNELPNNAYRNNTLASRLGWAFGSSTNLSATVRQMNSRYGDPNGVDLFGIAGNSWLTADATYVGATLQSQITDRWQGTLRFASMDQGSHSVTPSPIGQPFDPFGTGCPNYLGNVVTLHGANGYSVTGQGILDYCGTYPEVYDTNTTRRSGYAQTSLHLSSALDLSAGSHVEHEDGSTVYAGSPSSTNRTNAGAFTEIRATWHRVFASAGLGYEHNAIFKSAVTPRLSAAAYLRDPSSTAALGDTKLTFNAGTGIKAPSIAQELSSLYALVHGLPPASQPASAAGLSPIGPERNRSVDLGVEQGFWGGRARARASFFDNQFSDLIEFVSAGALPQLGIPTVVAAATGFGAYVNSSSYWARGLETSAEAKLGRPVRIIGSYTYLRAVVTQSFASSALAPAINPAFPTTPIGAYGPLVGAAPFRHPRNTGSLLVTFTKGPAQLSLAGYFAGKSDDSTFLSDGYGGNSMLLPNHDLDAAYQKVDVSGSYRIHPRVRGYVSLENVLDQRYEAAFGFPALGRAARTGVTVILGGDRSRQP